MAAKDLESWLDYKKIFETTKDANEQNITFLVEMISEGVLSIDQDTFEITHTLLFEIGEDHKISELKYKPRLNDRMLLPKMKGIAANDADGRLSAHIAALTNQPMGIIKSLDSIDKKIGSSIAVFFL